MSAGANTSVIRMDPPYVPNVEPVATWLGAIEKRISDATRPEGYQIMEPTQWVTEEVGAAARRFFQSTADILPSEPYLYASLSGALVAEFQTPNGALTTIISPNATTLFAVTSDDPETPIEVTVKRGSNRLREDLKPIAQALSSHGEVGSSNRR
jgi:hypothetical protein